MDRLVRFGVSMEAQLLKRFDALIEGSGQANRSEAVRDLVRARLAEAQTGDASAPALGVLTLVYDHHQRDVQERLTELQHDNHHAIISTTHVHIDHDHCLEVILLRGRVGVMRQMSDALRGLKGVLQSHLTLTAVQE
jgi:CopG family transcriptional regulator, nickel-responsive regulator